MRNDLPGLGVGTGEAGIVAGSTDGAPALTATAPGGSATARLATTAGAPTGTAAAVTASTANTAATVPSMLTFFSLSNSDAKA